MAAYRVPTDADVEAALRRVTAPQLRRAFFEGLRNPHWVTPLAAQSMFDNPPEPERLESGLIRDVYWPEIDYLIRVAPDAPKEVVDVLLKLQKSNNAWLRRGVFTIASSLPADQVVRVVPLIRAWFKDGFGWRTDPRDLVATCVNLLDGGHLKAGTWFANVLFRPSGQERRRQASLLMDDHWYRQALPEVAAALGSNALSVLVPWLETYERQIGHLTDTADHSSFSRESIRTNTDQYEQVEAALIDTVRDVAIQAMLTAPMPSVELLLKARMTLTRRIALFALAQAIEIIPPDEVTPMLETARNLLYAEESLNDLCRIEYGELARSAAAVSPDILDGLPRLLDDGARVDAQLVRQWLARVESDPTVVETRVEEEGRRWRWRWLSVVGATALPAALRLELEDLNAHFGVIESPLVVEDRITGWSGPNSPVSLDEMAAMRPSELVAHLENWHDVGDGWGPEPSHEGQGRQVTELVTTNPSLFGDVPDLIERLRPRYLRAVLEGWSAALKSGVDLDWDQTAGFVAAVLRHADGSAFIPEGGRFDDDQDFRQAKHAAVRLLQDLAQQRSGIVVPPDAMAAFAEMLIELAEDHTAWDEYVSRTNSGMDPLTLSLNESWPIRLRGLAYLTASPDGSSWRLQARAALERELARDDPHGAGRAVVGEALGRLVNTAADWVEAHAGEWFGEGALTVNQQIALTTALAVYRYHIRLYELLSAPMQAALRQPTELANGWRTQFDPPERIGQWVIGALIRGDKSFEDPLVQSFFSEAPPGVRGRAMGHIGWEFMHATVVDDPIRDRLADLWDLRVAHVRMHPDDHEELHDFYWFVKSKKFEIAWWLPRLREVLELDPDSLKDRYMIGKELAASADVDPADALAVLKIMMEERGDTVVAHLDLSRYAIPMVIARAIASPNAALRTDAEGYMNQLGEQGYTSLDTEVQAVLDGRVGQDDVGE